MNIFVSGIGGAGLGPLAEIALDAGFSVAGSDLHPSLISAELEKRGVKISYEQSAKSIAKAHTANPINWFVYTSALPETSPELQFVRENHIRFSKRDEFLAEFIREKNLKLIAVAGTHGKTTTTAMLIWLFRELKIPVSYSVGATLPFATSGAYDSRSEFFLYEADEYDRNFLTFSPEISLIPSLDYDHADIYKTPDDYDNAFREFISQSKKIVLWREAFAKLRLPSQDNLTILSGEVPRNDIDLPGIAMRQNAKLSLETLRQILPDFNEATVREILSHFPGSSRRFEQLAKNLYTDYAHHPTEIAATIEKAREIAKDVIAVYQPHQNLRQTEIIREGGYDDCFDGVKKIYWTPTYLVRGDLVASAPAVLTPQDLIDSLSGNSRNIAEAAELNNNLWAKITTHLKSGALVVLLGAGPIDAWAREQLTNLG